MKPYKSLIAAFAALASLTAVTSCDDDFDYPPIQVPVATIQPNTTIAEVKEAYWQDDRNYAVEIGAREDGSHIIVAGRVINNCRSGNIYKSLIIQDETAALAISLNETDMSTYYKVGQEVVIDLTGMSIGKYNGLQQIGEPEVYQDGFEVSFLDSDKFKEHAQVNGLPDMSKVDTLVTTMDEINAMTTGAEIARMQSRLIRLNNVSFQGGGSLKFCDPSSSTNRTITDENGNRMTLRMSNYATFANRTLPSGRGDLVCILSYYGTNWQLMIRDLSDCIFEGMDDDDNPGGEIPAVPDANTTVDKIVAKYWKEDLNYATQIGKNDAGEDEIVTLRVISSDASGNIFKQLMAQDATGALMFSVNTSNLYQNYPVGQAINVNLTGLYIGRRQGMLQVGIEGNFNGNPQPDRMDEGTWLAHVTTTGTAAPSDVKVYDATIDQISANPRQWSAQIVELKGVHFANGGKQTFVVGGQNTSQDLIDASGKKIIVRTSSYASFKDQTLPSGTGNVRAIVTYYNSTAQLVLNSADDCTGFDGSTPDTPDTPDVPTGTATFKKVTSVTSGKSYVFVHNGQVGTAINQTYSFGRYALKDVTITNNTLTTDIVNAVTFTQTAEGWTLVDGYGRYLGMDSDPTHKSNFQLYSSMQEGCTWTVTAEGGLFRIISVLRPELVIGQSGTFTNIAPTELTASGLNLPELYERAD